MTRPKLCKSTFCFCTLLLLLLLPALCAAGAHVKIEKAEAGIQNQVSYRYPSFYFEIANTSAASEFVGRLKSVQSHESRRSGERTSKTISQEVVVEAGSVGRVCFAMPEGSSYSGGSAVIDLVDGSSGAVLDSRTFDFRGGKDLTILGDEMAVGILAQNPDDIQAIQDAIVFPKDLGKREFFERAGVKFLHMNADSPPCWQMYAGLTGLVIAMPVGDLREDLKAAIETAMLKGLSLVIVDSFPGNKEYLATFGRVPDGVIKVREAEICRIDSVQTIAACTFLKPYIYPEKSPRAAARAELQPIRQSFADDDWTGEKFNTPHLPDPVLLLAAFGIYILFLGPLNFHYLRGKDRREKGWLTTLLIVGLFSAVLVVWIYFHQFHESQLDSVVVLYSEDTAPGAQAILYAQISSPTERTYSLEASGSWYAVEPKERTSFDYFSGRGTIEASNIAAPKWSSTMVSMSGLLRSAQAPVALQQGAIVNRSDKRFTEALLLTHDGYYEMRNFGPGQTWKVSRPEDLRSMIRPPWVRRRGPQESTTGVPLLSLTQAVRFTSVEEENETLGSIAAIFIGLTDEETVTLRLDRRPDVRHSWTIYFHVLKTGAVIDNSPVGSNSHA